MMPQSALVPASARMAMDRVISAAGLSRAALLSEQWFISGSQAAALQEVLVKASSDPTCDVVCVPASSGEILGEMTFTKGQVVEQIFAADGISVSLRKSQNHFHLKGFQASPRSGLVEQTATIMRAAELLLKDAGLSFADVRKATTYYVAGSSADELHDNMSVRNGYFAKPGPASTGLPVEGFPQSPSLVSISLFGSVA